MAENVFRKHRKLIKMKQKFIEFGSLLISSLDDDMKCRFQLWNSIKTDFFCYNFGKLDFRIKNFVNLWTFLLQRFKSLNDFKLEGIFIHFQKSLKF